MHSASWLITLIITYLTNKYMQKYDKHLIVTRIPPGQMRPVSDVVTMVTCQPKLALSSLKYTLTETVIFSRSSQQRCCWIHAGPGARLPRARQCASWKSLTRHFRSWCGAASAHTSFVPPARPPGTRTKTARRTFPWPPFYLERAGMC